jgi:hypothetical protein
MSRLYISKSSDCVQSSRYVITFVRLAVSVLSNKFALRMKECDNALLFCVLHYKYGVTSVPRCGTMKAELVTHKTGFVFLSSLCFSHLYS